MTKASCRMSEVVARLFALLGKVLMTCHGSLPVQTPTGIRNVSFMGGGIFRVSVLEFLSIVLTVSFYFSYFLSFSFSFFPFFFSFFNRKGLNSRIINDFHINACGLREYFNFGRAHY